MGLYLCEHAFVIAPRRYRIAKIMKRNSDKLEKAYETLGKVFGLPPIYLKRAVNSEQVSEQQVYETLKKYYFEWKENAWKEKKPTPLWVKEASNQFESDLSDVLEKDVWMPLPYTRIFIFGDYLASMETFIEKESENRESELHKWMEESKSDHDGEGIPEEWQALIPWIESAEGFASVLRNSFFVNLISYAEVFLTDRYRLNAKGESRDVPGSAVIERITDKLVGELKEKIPGWDEHILFYIKIRNCLVHNDGFLDDKKHQGIKDYTNRTPNLRTTRMINYYSKPVEEHDRIILTKEFCQQALAVVERFLLAIDFIANQLGTSGKPSRTDYLQES